MFSIVLRPSILLSQSRIPKPRCSSLAALYRFPGYPLVLRPLNIEPQAPSLTQAASPLIQRKHLTLSYKSKHVKIYHAFPALACPCLAYPAKTACSFPVSKPINLLNSSLLIQSTKAVKVNQAEPINRASHPVHPFKISNHLRFCLNLFLLSPSLKESSLPSKKARPSKENAKESVLHPASRFLQKQIATLIGIHYSTLQNEVNPTNNQTSLPRITVSSIYPINQHPTGIQPVQPAPIYQVSFIIELTRAKPPH